MMIKGRWQKIDGRRQTIVLAEPSIAFVLTPYLRPRPGHAYKNAAAHQTTTLPDHKTNAMGITKTEAYTERQQRLAALFKALGHPARIAILEQLLREDCCICRDFTNEIALSQPTISRHLGELKTAGVISGTTEGTKVSYCINPKRWTEVKSVLNALFDRFENGESCC